jgi:parallel beta-helix repeat protein
MMLLGMILISASAHSATWYVPDDHPTIQGAINAALNGDTIVVRPGTYNELIDFLGKAITVMSEQGVDVTIIDGDQLSGSVVSCQSGEGVDSVLDGFTITNGSGFKGGGMYNSSSNPTVTNCTFSGNSAYAPVSSGAGGGMYNGTSNPTVTFCIFSGNSSASGGGMFNDSSSNPTVTNCTFSENSAESGGGMLNYSSNPKVTNCTFSGNSASSDFWSSGGGMLNSVSNPTVTNCTFSENSAESGGGMFNYSSNPTVANCTFSGNSASSDSHEGCGGGMYNESSSNTTVTNCIFSENSASGGSYEGFGGGMYNISSSPTVTNTVLWNNCASLGPEIWIGITAYPSTLSISYSDVKGGQASVFVDLGCTLNWGSGMVDADPLFADPLNNDYHLTVCSPCIDVGDNRAPGIPGNDFDGELRIFDGNSDGIAVVDIGCDEIIGLNVPTVYPTIQNAIQAASNGENILVAAGTYMENINFLGKAIHVAGMGGSEATIINGSQAGSVAVFASGEGPDSMLEGFTLTNGMAAEGGGVFCYNTSPTLRKNKIKGNWTSGDGGGIFCYGSSAIIDKNIITQNTTCAEGGGIGCDSSDPLIEGNEILENQALRGGGIACAGSSPKILNNILFENCAESGAGILAESLSSPVVTNNTLYANTALSSGGGIHCGSEFLSITNTIVWNNDAPTDPQISGSNATVTYSNVQGGWPGTGNIDADPLFVDPGNGDFHLIPESPCLNKGDNNAPELPVWDIEADPRITYFIVDMGADEFYSGGHVIHVPLDSPTIQGAIDAAIDGDTVLVEPGTYFENIDFKEKAIIVKSSLGPNHTTIDGQGVDRAVSFTHSEDHGSILQGFTITNGIPGIYCYSSSPTIKENIITKNIKSGVYCENYSSPIIKKNIISENWAYSGGGMRSYDSSPQVTECTFIGNVAEDGGGGMRISGSGIPTVISCTFTNNHGKGFGGGGLYISGSGPLVINCTFTNNHASYIGGGMSSRFSAHPTVVNCSFYGNTADVHGGGMSNQNSSPSIINCTFTGNSAATYGGGMYNSRGSSTYVTNTILWNNCASSGPEIGIGITADPSTFTISYSDVEGGQSSVYVEPGCTLNWGPGNIDADPLFLDPWNDDYHLSYASPCIDAGDNHAPSLPSKDFEGDPRIFPGNGKGYLVGSPPPGVIVDMGADEYCLTKRGKFVSR